MGFKMKSGNKVSFKNMGSPILQTGGNYMIDSNTLGDKSSSPAQKKEFNFKSKGNFNISGSKASTTPGYSTTKAAKTQNFRNAANKIKTVSSKTNKGSKVINAFKNTPKQYVKPAKEIAKKGLKKIVSKVVAPLAVATTLYDMYKSGQKHSGGKAVKGQKSFMADAKKNTKSIYKKK